VLLGLAVVAARPAAADDSAAAVARLIDRLASQDFAEREKASGDLEALGPAVLEPLRRAARGDDLEVRRRAGELVQRLEARALSEKLLAPTRVRLTYDDVPLRAALEDLQRRAGLRLTLHDPENKLADRRVTLDTGDVPLWEAFDAFCRKAGLAEPSPGEPGQAAPTDSNSLPTPPPIPVGRAVGAQAPAMPVQAAQVQIQLQVAGQPPMVTAMPATPGVLPSALALADGKPQPFPAHVAGAVRLRALPPDTPVPGLRRRPDEVAVILQVLPEPKLEWRGVLAVSLDRATDDEGQALARAGVVTSPGAHGVAVPPGSFRAPPPTRLTPQVVAVRLRKGDKPSRALRELVGTVLAQVQTEPEPLLTVDRVLQSAGRTVKGQWGGFLRLVRVDRADDGSVTLHVQVENPPDVVPAVLRAATAAADGPPAPLAGQNGLHLLDDKGNALPLVPLHVQAQSNGAAVVWEYTFLHQPRRDQGEPDRLVFAGTRTVTVDIPFTIADVPLP
jgi:hypothetical protein